MKNIKQFDNSKTRENVMQEFEVDLHYLNIDVEDEYLCDKEMDKYASEIL